MTKKNEKKDMERIEQKISRIMTHENYGQNKITGSESFWKIRDIEKRD